MPIYQYFRLIRNNIFALYQYNQLYGSVQLNCDLFSYKYSLAYQYINLGTILVLCV
jgi:hypothetical protein